MAEKFPTPQERAMAWLLEATEIGGMSRPETALYAYQAGFTAAHGRGNRSRGESVLRGVEARLLPSMGF